MTDISDVWDTLEQYDEGKVKLSKTDLKEITFPMYADILELEKELKNMRGMIRKKYKVKERDVIRQFFEPEEVAEPKEDN